MASDSPERQHELDAIRTRIGLLEAQLARLDSESSTLEAELERTELEVRLQERQVEEAKAERRIAEAALEATAEEAVVLEAALDRARRDLSLSLGSLYRLEEKDLLRSFLTSEGEGALEEMRLLRLMSRRDAHGVERYLSAREDLSAKREQLAARQEVVAEAAAREAARLRRLGRMQVAQSRALELMRERRQSIAAKASTLADKEEKLSLLMAILSGRAEAPAGEIAIQAFQGALDWPLRGEVVQGFGMRSEERYQTKIPHNGIEIAATRSSEVKVVFPGVVVFSSPFEDFGVTVVVHHPDRVFSLYAGLETAAVAKGDVLSFADALGSARDSVYFEIRVDNRPQDPLHWLR